MSTIQNQEIIILENKNHKELEKEINEKIQKGWILHEQLIAHPYLSYNGFTSNHINYIQVMINGTKIKEIVILEEENLKNLQSTINSYYKDNWILKDQLISVSTCNCKKPTKYIQMMIKETKTYI